MDGSPQTKTCFVISPIGKLGSEQRRNADEALFGIIKPAAEACGYNAIRADEISEPGQITTSIIDHLNNDPLVIADLTDQNPNVFYELAIRHAVHKPVIQIAKSGTPIPFDITQERTIHYELTATGGRDAERKLVKYIQAVEQNPDNYDNPISHAIQIDTLRRSDEPVERILGQILQRVDAIYSSPGRYDELITSVARSDRVHLELNFVHLLSDIQNSSVGPLSEPDKVFLLKHFYRFCSSTPWNMNMNHEDHVVNMVHALQRWRDGKYDARGIEQY